MHASFSLQSEGNITYCTKCTVRYTAAQMIIAAAAAAMLSAPYYYAICYVLLCYLLLLYFLLLLIRLLLLQVAAGASVSFQKGTFAAAIFNVDAVTLWGESATNSHYSILQITFSGSD